MHDLPRRVLCGVCGVLAVSSAMALDPARRISQYVHSSWSHEAGLPSSTVTSLLQSRDGYLWIGTTNGLARFDGVRLRVFDRRSTPALLSSSIAGIAEDAGGVLYVGTNGSGVLRYQRERFEPVSAVDGLLDARIVCLVKAPDGDIWAGGYGGLAQIRDGQVIRRFSASDGLLGNPVMSIDFAPDGQLWVATKEGPQTLHQDRFRLADIGALGDFSVRDLFRLRDGQLVLRSIDGALARQSANTFVPWRLPGSAGGAGVRWLLEDRDQNLWVGSEQDGLYRVRGNAAEQVGEADGLGSSRVRTLLEDREGALWIGTSDAGLHRLRDGLFTTWGRPEGLASAATYSVLEDAPGSVWIGTDSGLTRLSGSRLHAPARADGRTAEAIRALHRDPIDGSLWVGSFAGLDRLSEGKIEQKLGPSEGLPGSRVMAVLKDRRGDLWIGTFGSGLARLSNGTITVHNQADGLADDFVYALHESASGVLWVGTANGVSTLRDARLSKDGAALVDPGPITSFHEDARGVLWIGTEEHAIYRWEQGRVTAFAEVPDFPEDTVYSILEDASQRLWFGSYRGIFRIDRQQLDSISSGQGQRLDVMRFGLNDGLRSIEANGGQQPSSWRGADGRLWFTTMNGVSVVDPAQLEVSLPAPQPQIETLLADDRPIALGTEITLPAGTRRLEIQYAAASLATPERIGFRVQLEGFDRRWNDVGQARVAHFTSLERGNYKFRVGTSDELGKWGSSEAQLAFSIAPYYYQTWWFRLALAIAVVLTMWSLYRLRLTWLESQNAVLRERQRIAGEIHDNLAQSFTGLIYHGEAAIMQLEKSDATAAAEHMETVCELAAHGADAARHSMWELGARRSQRESLLQSITSMARRLTQGRKLEVAIHGGENAWSLSESVEHQVLYIAQAAIANAIEHAACRRINVELGYERHRLTLQVRDDGIGFDPDQAVAGKGRGFGLENQRQRARDIGARLEIHSACGAGTSVSLRVPRRQWTWYLLRTLNAVLRRRAARGSASKDPNPVG